jgi:hypothetical protein
LTQQSLPIAERWPTGVAGMDSQSISLMGLLAGMIIYLQIYFESRVFPWGTQHEY